MLRRALCTALSATVIGRGLSGIVSADDRTMITGIVTVAAADAKEAATVKVGKDGKVIYKITKDDNGKKVAAEAKGKKVEIKGKVEEKDGEKWITVTSCKIVE
ncbi:MAG TPA: hypothetical protein VGP72_27085 [Planctomycetota bacterium]